MTTITLSAARRGAAAAHASAAGLGIAVAVTVVDAGVHPIVVERHDGAAIAAVDASLSKARTTLYFGGTPTADLAGATAPGAPLFGFEHAIAAPVAFVAGAVPVHDASGALVGAIGVGGGSPAQDHEIAAAAARAIEAAA